MKTILISMKLMKRIVFPKLDWLLGRQWGLELCPGSVTDSDHGFESDFELGVEEEEEFLPPYQEVEADENYASLPRTKVLAMITA